jgi:hypothetical protein
MNYIKHLTGFFDKANHEKKFRPTHISLYLALFQCWNLNRFQNPTGISRMETMNASKINSKVTYHKCMRELEQSGYIEYFPTYNTHVGTKINMFDFSCEIKTKSKNKACESSISGLANGQVNGQANGPAYIYNKQTNTNNINLDIEPELHFFNESGFLENKNERPFALHNSEKKEKIYAKKENELMEIPSLELVKEYFQFQKDTVFEAERFFNYYSSNGWLIGGKTIMKDWKASARNWMLNTAKFTVNLPKNNMIKEQPRANNLHTLTDKNYAEPL